MAQRLVRAKRKIKTAEHSLPGAGRTTICRTGCNSVLASLYLIFNEGYSATSDEALVRERAQRRGDPPGRDPGAADA